MIKRKSIFSSPIMCVLFSVACSAGGSVVLSCIAATVCGGFYAAGAVLSRSRLKLLPFLPLISGAISYIITSDFFCALLSMAFFPVAIVIYYGITHGKTRSQTITGVAIALGAFICLVYLSHISYKYVGISAYSIKSYAKDFLVELRSAYKYANDTFAAQKIEGKTVLFTSEQIDQNIKLVKLSFSGIFISLMLISGMVSTWITRSSLIYCKDADKYAGLIKWRFILSKTAAAVYLILLLVSLCGGADTESAYVAVNTIMMPIKLGLMYMGIFAALAFFKSRTVSPRFKALTVLLCVLFMGSYISSLLSMFGVFTTLAYKPDNEVKA